MAEGHQNASIVISSFGGEEVTGVLTAASVTDLAFAKVGKLF